MTVPLTSLVLVTCTSFAWSQESLLVRWNDTVLVDARDPRRLIFHNEINMRTSAGGAPVDGNGVLICRYSGNDPSTDWRRPDGSNITLSNNDDFDDNDDSDFKQFISTGNPTRVQLARARDPLQDGASNDGLWTCNADGQQPLHVPLYTPGKGVIEIDSLTLGDPPSFSRDSPRFTLIVNTRGGPPTTFMWRRNGVRINGDTSVEVNPNGDATGRMNSIYRSSLAITAVQPGVYTYETSNRATSPSVSRSITIEGGSITNLQITQTELNNGQNMVRLTWNPPPGPPANVLYHVSIIGRSNINATVTTTTYAIELDLGSYDFKVMFLSQHFPAIPATIQNFKVAREFAPNITLSPPTTTSVTVSWSQPMFSFTVQYYEVSVVRLTMCSEVTGIRGPRRRNSNDMEEPFEDLEEFIEYRANITAVFQSTPGVSTVTNFTTLPTVPSRIPSNVIPMTSSRTISVSWDAIGCLHHNGLHFRYEVDFQRMDGGTVPAGTVNNLIFTVEGLEPFTDYTFRVRGVNDEGNGDYTSLQVIQTNGVAPSEVPGNVIVPTVTSRIISVSWDAIDTRNQYGPNFHYEVEFLRTDGRSVPMGTVNNVMFTVMGLQPFTNYTFRVRGVNDAGNGDFTRIIMIQTSQDVPSEVPSNVAFNVTSRSINVSWNFINPRNKNGPNFQYQIEFMQIELATTIKNSHFFDGLQPFTNYAFRVRGVNDFGNGNYTSLTVIQTNGEAPSEVPGNVMLLNVTSKMISVSWDAIDTRNQYGPNFRYDVEFLRTDGRSVPVGTVNNVMFIVMGLQPYTNYTFRVRGVNDAGNGNYTRLTVIQTSQDVPSEVPSNVAFNVTSRSISVSWNPINPSNENGPNFHYQLEFMQIIDVEGPVITTVDNSQLINGLQPFTNYTFRVRGVNDFGNGDYTNLTVIQTNGEAPSEVPGNVMVLTVSSKMISVSWDAIDERNRHGPNFRYEVNFQQFNRGPIPVGTVNNVMFTVMGLLPFTNYTFRVRGVNDVGSGNYSRLIHIKTLQDVPSEVPSNVIFNVTSRSVSVSWDPIDSSNENGPNFHYELEFMQIELERPLITTVDNSQLIDELQPFTNYTFRVRGVNNFGNGDYTSLFVIQTREDVPGRVLSLDYQLINSNSALITWSPPLEPNGIIITYELFYHLNENVMSKNISSYLKYDVVESEGNSRISRIMVRAYTSIGPGPIADTASTVRVPVTVMDVRVKILTDTSVEVSWDNVTAIPNITEYIVYYAPVSSSRKRQDNEQNVTVPSTENSAVISGLNSTVEYRYQVTFVAMLGTMRIEGNRSPIDENTRLKIIEPGDNVAVIVVVIVVVALIVGAVLAVLALLWLRRRKPSVKIKGRSAHLSVHCTTAGQTINMQDVDQIKPQIDDFPKDTVAVEGESVVFKATVSGKPIPTLTWYFNNTEVTPDYSQEILNDGSLRLPSAEVKQSGIYMLLARNSAGSVQQQVKLTVQTESDNTPKTVATINFEPVPVAEFGDYVAKNHSNSNQGFKDQFLVLESGDHYAKTIGLSSKYKKLNRFANITNYDHNRIVLEPLQGHPDYTNDFINGCYIDGYSLPKKFIATQGPTPLTMIDFWRLIWQEKPPTVVMVTNLEENNKAKCEQYWPDSGTKTFGPFEVTLAEYQVFADYCIRTLRVTVEGSNHSHKIKQFHFTDWPDHGVPDYATPMLAFHRRIAFAHSYRKGPMLVHCSAGVGRTGTFICIDSVLEQIKKEKMVDIAGIINKMRHQRMKMVQTIEQYCFLHDAMLESVTCGDTQISAADLRMKITKFQKVDHATGLTTFQSQFTVLEQVSPKLSDAVCKEATRHWTKNRSTNYLPPDRHRVILKGEQPDYIHASFINGYKHQKAYMIAEGPMSSTTRNMLKLLCDRTCGVVVMLSGLQENGKESCFQYWPALGATATHGEYTVELVSEETLEGFTIRKINILERKSKKAHQVTQFHVTCWSPDGQCSNLRSVVDVINEMDKVQRGTGNMPILVHCSDTVTRSSMFCAMATVIDRCKTEGVVDVFQVVKALRVQRPGAIPTVENYKTLFDVALSFLDSFDTYANFQNV